MEGLFKKALLLRRQKQLLSVIKSRGTSSIEGLNLPEGEGRKILAEIDRAVSGKKLLINDKTFSFTSKKKSFGLPLIINASAVLVIAAGVFIFSQFFRLREESIFTGSKSNVSTEGMLIEKLKEESQAKIAGKEAEIAATRVKLADIAAEKNQLERDIDRRISEREEELRRSIEEEMVSERVRLAGEGRTQEDIDKLLREMENARAAESARQLEEFRQQVLRELEEKTNAIALLTAEYLQILSRQENEQQQIESAFQDREAELTEELRTQEASLRQETSVYAENLTRIEKQQENRQLVLDQIRSSYEKTNGYLKDLDYAKALTQLSSLEKYLRQRGIASLPYMQDRLQVEFFIIDSLRKLITGEADRSGEKTASLVQTASDMTAVSGMVEEADSLFENGEMEKATELYLAALNEIPDLKKSYARLQEIEEISFQQRRETLSNLISTGDNLYGTGNYNASLQQYGQALAVLKEDSVDFNRLIGRISEAGYRIGTAEITARENREAAKMVEEGSRLYTAGDYGSAISAYAASVQRYPNSTYLETAMEGLQNSMRALIGKLERNIASAEEELKNLEARETAAGPAALERERNTEIIRQLESIKSLYAGYSEFSQGTGERSQAELYSLLQAKLLMKKVLNSDAVRAEHPELYDSIQRYYDAFGEEKWKEGRNSTMRDMIAFIDILANPGSHSDSDAAQATTKLAYQDELFTEFLEKLRVLIR